MDYEKKYKEALERAKIYRDNAKAVEEYSAVARYENIFPELHENDDERIRKKLIKTIGYFRSRGIDQQLCEEFIAYLEKQKERGPLTKEEEYTLHRIIEYLEDEACPSEWIDLLHDIYCLPYEKQKERKPIEGVVKDITKNKESAINFLKSAGILDDNGELAEMYRSEQNPAWGEEDERIKSCIGLALTDIDEQRFKDFGTTLKDCIAWLKSLRPSWKPSEEQMEALNAMNCCGELSYQGSNNS